MGLSVGNYTYSLSNGDSIQVNVNGEASAVPEPATWAMMLLGFGAIGTATRRRKTAIRFAPSPNVLCMHALRL